VGLKVCLARADRTAEDLLLVPGPWVDGAAVTQKSTDDLVRQAADAVRPIFEVTVEELGLGLGQAQRLMLRLVEVYIKGRADGADTFALEVNRALAADGILAAIRPKHAPVRVPRRRSGLGPGIGPRPTH
jgi:hypothetical protein